MPELPEVETTVRQLQRKVRGRTFIDVWTDFKKMIKRPSSLEKFKEILKGKKIQRVWRRGKNIIFDLSGYHSLLVHQKLTGHFLSGEWRREGNIWQPPPGPLSDKVNTYIHLLFTFDDGQQLALSDLRKFAKAELLNKDELKEELSFLGPEPLGKRLTLETFKKILRRARGKIKQVLMDQTVIAGIGNIYSDEILWQAKIHPLKETSQLSEKELKNVYQAMRKILPLAVKLCGESISDYRTLSGEAGFFDKARKVYRREGEKCSRCGKIIKRIKLAGRSARFCPNCQLLKV
jgi:formamidopyrimidine-DNA glycosylase